MRVCLYLDRSRIFRWHFWLAEALAAMPGWEVSVTFSQHRQPLPKKCVRFLDLERFVYRTKGPNAIDPVSDTAIEAVTNGNKTGTFDAVVDFAGLGDLLPCQRVLTPCFNHATGEIGAIAGLFDTPLVIEVRDSARPVPLTAHPAAADDILGQSLNTALSCTVRLIIKSLTTSIPAGSPIRYSTTIPVTPALTVRAVSVFSHKMARYLEILAKGGKNWSVGWRIDPTSTLLDAKTANFAVLPDDGKRYYADPFPFRHGGTDCIFVEELPFGTGRGHISVATIEDGRIGTPRPVLEEPYHLSYPFVFEHGGEVWMIPETGEARGVYLYRAERYPDKWKREGCLVEIDGYDSTLFQHNGRFWLFICERVWNSSSWDTLSLFYADSLTGPWLAHADNPVLFDATLSRPGGAMFTHNGSIIRPVQDCSHQYGSAIFFCRVDALGPNEFTQTPIGRMHSNRRGCHTYNNHAGLEVIDVFGRQRSLTEMTASVSAW
jgi:hypothetical protein